MLGNFNVWVACTGGPDNGGRDNDRTVRERGARGWGLGPRGIAGRPTLLRIALVVGLAAGIPFFAGLGVTGAWARYHYGSDGAALAFLRGESFVFDPQPLDVGIVTPGRPQTLELRALNFTGRAIRINGFVSMCMQRDGCVECLDQLPLFVEPRSSRILMIQYRYKGPLQVRSVHLTTQAFTEFGPADVTVVGTIDPSRDRGWGLP